MRRGTRPLLLLGVAALAAALAAALVSGRAESAQNGKGNNVLRNAVDIELGKKPRPERYIPLSSGALYPALAAESANSVGSGKGGSTGSSPGGTGTVGCFNKFVGGGVGLSNVRVNQDCSLRRQAEEVVAVNPTNEDNLIAGQNDSRVGFNACGYDFSFDGGRTWGDMVPPFYQYIMLNGLTADACSDPTVTFDADGNAYVAGILFQIFDFGSSLVVAKSNAGIGGAFYHTPADLSFQTSRTSPLGVVAEDFDPNIFHDKEFIVADAGTSSPKQNNVYVTWTRFDFDTGAGVGVHSPIYFSQSTDGGATWSNGIEIDGSSAAFCTDFSGSADPNACDQDQGSHPIVGPDGTVYVVFTNGNTPTLNQNQQLIVKCGPASDCSSAASWSVPVKVGDVRDSMPVGPVASTGCPAGRQCIPPNGYRVTSFTSATASVDAAGNVYVTWFDSRNLGASCNPDGAAATATPPCDTDVHYAFSTDGGSTWSSTKTITPAGSAQWQPWSAVTGDGTLFVGYYDRSYGTCETTGCNDITVAKIPNAASAGAIASFRRVTTASMPNLIVANNPLQAGFLGDYMWVATDSRNRAHVAWADTRGRGGTLPEEDIYYATVR